VTVYFYELHEGDDDVFSDVLVGTDVEYDPEDFFELVQEIRRRIQDTFEDDTLVEAIAAELEREHGFVFISDDRLAAAVNVSRDEEDNFLAPVGGDARDDDEEEDEEDERAADFRTILAEFDPADGEPRPH
jgi:hypothetical protein